MSYRVVTELRFTEQHNRLTQAEQEAEQVGAIEDVIRNGGELGDVYVLPHDKVAVVVATYPDEESSIRAHLQIQARGNYDLRPARAFLLDEWTALLESARAGAVVSV